MGNGIRQIINKRSIVVSLFLIFYSLNLDASHASNSNPPSPFFSKEGNMTGPPLEDVGGLSHKVITLLEVEGLHRIKEEELLDLICFNTGDVFDKKGLSDGIRRAYKKGIFLDIRAVAEPYKEGIKLKYIVKEVPIIRKIIIGGNKHVPGRNIRRELFFKKGEDFRTEHVNEAELSVLNLYRRKGFPDARVTIAAEDTKKPSTVILRVHIEEGQPLVVNRLDAPSDIRRLMTLSEGDIFDTIKLDKDIKRIRKHYKKSKHLNPVIGPYHYSNGTLVIPVDPGPILKLSFRNNKAISSRKLRKEVPFMDNEEVTDEAISETVNRMEMLYKSKGYYYASVAAGVERNIDEIHVTFIVFEGEPVVLRKVLFPGVTITHEVLKTIIPLVEEKPFNNNLLSSSRESLVRFYNALGYLEMDVIDIKKSFYNDGRDVDLEFIIGEGHQTKIESIEIEGNKDISLSEIRSAMRIKEKSPYNVIDIGDARYEVMSLYIRRGYRDARIDVESRFDGGRAFLTFRITENKPSVIGKIIIRGNNKTKAKIINRELTVAKGEVYNHEEITKSKQRLYKLGIFNEVSLDALEPSEESEGRLVRDMLVSVKEGKAGSIEVAVGYGDYEELRGSLDISYRNLGGYNRVIGFRTELSKVEERYIFNFREPWLFNQPDLPLKLFLISEKKRSINIETRDTLYKVDKFSFIAGVDKELAKGLKAGLNYEYSYTDTKDVDPDVILSKEDTGTLGIGSISPSLFYDTRDNPFDPASGSIHGVVLKWASGAFLSETEFIKGTFQSTWFLPLRKGIVFAMSLRGGAAQAFEDSKELPLIERFFLGGRTTVRGYTEDTLGPKGEDGNPTGGNIFALTNFEFRISLGKGFSLVTFLDSGNVWQKFDDINSEIKSTVGAGLRFKTPVGPISVDYGHKLDRESGESSGEVHFSFGHAF